MKSLLSWVVSGLDELDQQASGADTASFDHAMSSPGLYPSYQPLAVPGPGPNSPPLQPGKVVEEVQEVGMSRQQSDDSRARFVRGTNRG